MLIATAQAAAPIVTQINDLNNMIAALKSNALQLVAFGWADTTKTALPTMTDAETATVVTAAINVYEARLSTLQSQLAAL